MAQYLQEAMALKDEIVSHRRYLHQHAELGFDLTQTRAYVMKNLISYGYQPQELGGGVTCTVGSGAPVILLRADMDALPQQEVSGLPFACTEGACHSCGHDCHTTMLLMAAKLLKAHESELKGTVKFCFQPAEELLAGSRSMIDAGIMENPHVDAAIGMHLDFGPRDTYRPTVGTVGFNDGPMMASADAFHIEITGQSAHGSLPQLGISALNVATAVADALTKLPTLEMPGDETIILSVCRIVSGTATNIIPDSAVVEGSFRAYNRECRKKMCERIEEVSTYLAKAWRAEAKVSFPLRTASLLNDADMTHEMAEYCKDVVEKIHVTPPQKGSEDFANYTEHVPCFFLLLGAGDGEYGWHDPHVQIDEGAMPYGVALLCTCASRWLENHQK